MGVGDDDAGSVDDETGTQRLRAAPERASRRPAVASRRNGMIRLAGISRSYHLGDETVGRTLVLFCCACKVAAGLALLFYERRLWRGALVQVVPPLVVLLTSLL